MKQCSHVWNWREEVKAKECDPQMIKRFGFVFLIRVWPVMFVVLSGSQELLNILGDLLGFSDDVLGAGKCRVWLHLHIIQFRDWAALSQPAAALQPPSPAETVESNKNRRNDCLTQVLTHFNLLQTVINEFNLNFLPQVICLWVMKRVVVVTFWHAALLFQLWGLEGGKATNQPTINTPTALIWFKRKLFVCWIRLKIRQVKAHMSE